MESLRRRLGFTLIELLVVTVILSLVVGVIAACFAGGLRVWDRVQQFNAREVQTTWGLDLLERDLRNAIVFAGIGFAGAPDEVRFPALLVPPASDDAEAPVGTVDPEAAWRIGSIRYFVDAGRKALVRQEWVYPLPPEEARTEPVMEGVADLRMTYGGALKEAGAGQWKDTWSSSNSLPRRVRITITRVGEEKDPGREAEGLSRTVLLALEEPAMDSTEP